MGTRNAIGVDPGSKGFLCAFVKTDEAKVVTKGYTVSRNDLASFIRWVKGAGEVTVAIEGLSGISGPIEKALREAGIVFYSFKASAMAAFRRTVMGQNKNDAKDAEAVARFAIALEAQGILDRYRRVWLPNEELRTLSRFYERKSMQTTASINELWKLLRQASPDLYLLLQNGTPEIEMPSNVVTAQGLLALFSVKPDPGDWKHLSQQQLYEAMGGRHFHERRSLIEKLQKAAATLPSTSATMALLIQTEARQIECLKHDLEVIKKRLDELIEPSATAQKLLGNRGIGTITAATMTAEIIDIRRFASEDRLASYSGLGRREHVSGETARMVPTHNFNRRLKDAFMTAAKNFVRFNPDSHLSGYYRNLIKAGMTPLEATKRVARALVRVIYKQLSELIATDCGMDGDEGQTQQAGSDMASGLPRGKNFNPSNMSLPAQAHDTTNGLNVQEDASKRTMNTRRQKKTKKHSKIA